MNRKRAAIINNLAMDQTMMDRENESEIAAEDAANINQASFRNEWERRQFKHDYRRHARNIAEGNPFYGL
ncbi:MAG: hypothetical protein KIT09_30460 [Bryobacteraceae bacterium]|nr:hypothetical protein [Bryobacteraceae bacterium]